VSVLMPNAMLAVRRRDPETVDAHGYVSGGTYGPVAGPWPGRIRERGGDGGWTLAVDPNAWPVRRNDLIVEPASGREWLVRSADMAVNNIDPRVDSIRVEALQRRDGATEPGGPEFAAR
jgi:hypothetical protein